ALWDGDEQMAVMNRLADGAAQMNAAPILIEATILRALAAASRGDLGGAVDLCRTACSMAQADHLPLEEHLSYLVLSRLRRYTNRPYLAAHILRALARIASPI